MIENSICPEELAYWQINLLSLSTCLCYLHFETRWSGQFNLLTKPHASIGFRGKKNVMRKKFCLSLDFFFFGQELNLPQLNCFTHILVTLHDFEGGRERRAVTVWYVSKSVR